MGWFVVLAFVLSQNIYETHGYKILGLWPYYGESHMGMFGSIMEELALKGHEVHVLSHYPRKAPILNYTDFSLSGAVRFATSQLSFDTRNGVLNIDSIFRLLSEIHTHEDIMKSAAVQELLKSEERYDLIVTESFTIDMTLGFVHKFKVPFVSLSTCALPPWTSDVTANPQNPAFVPNLLSPYSPKMTFFERVGNTLEFLTLLATWYGVFLPANQGTVKKYFGNDTPPLLDIIKNVSLVLVNSHPTVHGARPYAPNVIEVGGVHIKSPEVLPKDIQTFIDESTHGVVYFCMGSLFRGALLPEQKKKAFLSTFSRLKERVLWKFEDDGQPVPKNVMVKQWMPQRDILAHANVKLFVSHGGLIGTLEAVSEGKPILGIAVRNDQVMNIRSLELQGSAKFFDFSTIDNESIYEAVTEMLKPKYAERAREIARQFHDRPMSPMETAIYWIEYVIRNKGARNLHSVAVDLPFYQYLLLDVILFFVCCLVVGLLLILCLFRYFLYRESMVENKRRKRKEE